VEVANIAQRGDWSENYIVDLFDWHLSVSETYPDYIGNAQWAFKDFGTPLRPENDIPYMNQKGLVDREGNPKDAYYVFKSYWSDEPFAYIESHSWTDRSGPEGVERNISVFSSMEEVELLLNGESLGKKKKDMTKFPACGLNWDVLFAEGDNTLEAIAYKQREVVAKDELKLNYSYQKAGAPSGLYLSYERLSEDEYLITSTARDKEGLRCLDYEDRVYFQCLSGGNLRESLGTPQGTSAISMANGRASIRVSADNSGQPLQVMVLNQSFKGTYLTIPTEEFIKPLND